MLCWLIELNLIVFFGFFCSFFSDVLESEAKSVLLEIRHPAMKKQVFSNKKYSNDRWVHPALWAESLYIFTFHIGLVKFLPGFGDSAVQQKHFGHMSL